MLKSQEIKAEIAELRGEVKALENAIISRKPNAQSRADAEKQLTQWREEDRQLKSKLNLIEALQNGLKEALQAEKLEAEAAKRQALQDSWVKQNEVGDRINQLSSQLEQAIAEFLALNNSIDGSGCGFRGMASSLYALPLAPNKKGFALELPRFLPGELPVHPDITEWPRIESQTHFRNYRRD